MFRPEQFFVGKTRGWGVVQEIGGRKRRCRISTDGRLNDAYQAVHFDEIYSYDDGRVDEWRWAMTRGRDGRYVAAEHLAGAGIVGRHDKGDYFLRFTRPLKPEGGFPTPSYRARFTLMTPSIAMKRVQVSILGLPVGTMTAFHERVV